MTNQRKGKPRRNRNYRRYNRKPIKTPFLKKGWVRFLFSVSIMVSAIPSIYQDFTYGHKGEWTHYGMMLVGILYFIESLLWTLEIWQNYKKNSKNSKKTFSKAKK